MAKVYGEILVSVVADSKEELEQHKSTYSANGLRADLTLIQTDGESKRVEVLEVIEADWESFDEE
ncbi:hypothetical protein JOC34_000853 [Virgibacillus halotolerans]|uniref:hypothetical protein n=1 Tax=Virgibacillus halotolerans TaxID=1071053 RepID=UPI00195F83E4|nr:hypothetical protein [Virgibacillus halotolerans]MBM7598496.1 hypothetical protein [Virgibacillus halotolerans]